MSDLPDLAWQLIDRRLDGDLDDDAWAAAFEQYGPSLTEAFDQARSIQQDVQEIPCRCVTRLAPPAGI